MESDKLQNLTRCTCLHDKMDRKFIERLKRCSDAEDWWTGEQHLCVGNGPSHASGRICLWLIGIKGRSFELRTRMLPNWTESKGRNTKGRRDKNSKDKRSKLIKQTIQHNYNFILSIGIKISRMTNSMKLSTRQRNFKTSYYNYVPDVGWGTASAPRTLFQLPSD